MLVMDGNQCFIEELEVENSVDTEEKVPYPNIKQMPGIEVGMHENEEKEVYKLEPGEYLNDFAEISANNAKDTYVDDDIPVNHPQHEAEEWEADNHE